VQPYAVSGALTLLALLEGLKNLLHRPVRIRKYTQTDFRETLSNDLAFRVLLHTRVRHIPTAV
jgi:hypothetical protein